MPTLRQIIATCGIAAFMLGGAPALAQGEAPTMEAFDIEFEGQGEVPPPEMFVSPSLLSLGGAGESIEVFEMPVLASGGDAFFLAELGPGGPGGPDCPPGSCPKGFGGGGPMGNMTLSDDQMEKMWEIKKGTASQMAGKMGSMMSARMDLKDLMLQPTVDKSRAQSAQDKINSLTSDIANIKLQERISMLAVLTDEQRKELRRSMLRKSACPMGGGGRHHMMMRRHHRSK